MKIAVLYLGRKGGGALYTFHMADLLEKLNIQKNFFLSKDIENLKDFRDKWEDEIDIFTTISRNPLDILLIPINIIRIIIALRKFNPDIVYVPMLSPFVPFIFLHPWKTKIFTLHGQYRGSIRDWFVDKMQNIILMQSDKVIVLSEHYKKIAESKYNKEAYLVPHPIFERRKTKEKEKTGKEKLVLFIGRVGEYYKGSNIMLEAFEKAKKKVPDLKLVIAGKDSSKYSERKGIEAIDKWLTEEEFEAVVSKSDIVCVPYLLPTPSGVVSTAIAFGKPVIASNLPGLNEQVEDGLNGLLFESGNADELADKIIKLVKDKNMLEKLAEGTKTKANKINLEIQKSLKGAFNVQG